MKYKSNYLTNVVFQLRFSPILVIDSEGLAQFQQQIKDNFPQVKEGREIEIEAKMTPKQPMTSTVKSVKPRWTFFSEDKLKILSITSKEFTLEYRKHSDIEHTKQDFEFLWTRFNTIYGVKQLERAGLRYINQIVISSGDPVQWEGYIKDNLLKAILGIQGLENHSLARSMHTINWGHEDHRITFQFGIHNSDFPSAITKKEFILDYDCYSLGVVDASDAIGCLSSYNEIIARLFEQSIESGLRELMGVVEE